MTIESNISKNIYKGNGQATIFPFTFKIWKESELLVTIQDDKGITNNITPYAVTIGDNGGEAVLYFDNEEHTPIPAGYSIAITRNMPFLQEQDYINGGRFNAEVVENNFDIACAERQELLEKLQRAVIMSPTDNRSPEQVLQDFISKYNEINIKYPEIIQAFNVIYPRIEEVLKECIANKNLAQAWAESETPPDPDAPESKSSKEWAAIAADIIPIASKTLAGKVKAGESIDVKADGTIDVAQSVLNGIENNFTEKIDKTAISDDIYSESSETVASSKAVNDLRIAAPGLAMPSDKYIEIAPKFISDGNYYWHMDYTAPANGYLSILVKIEHTGISWAGGEMYIPITINKKNYRLSLDYIYFVGSTAGTKNNVFLTSPVKKGTNVVITLKSYTKPDFSENTYGIRFIYAEGEI